MCLLNEASICATNEIETTGHKKIFNYNGQSILFIFKLYCNLKNIRLSKHMFNQLQNIYIFNKTTLSNPSLKFNLMASNFLFFIYQFYRQSSQLVLSAPHFLTNPKIVFILLSLLFWSHFVYKQTC